MDDLCSDDLCSDKENHRPTTAEILVALAKKYPLFAIRSEGASCFVRLDEKIEMSVSIPELLPNVLEYLYCLDSSVLPHDAKEDDVMFF